MTGRRLWSCLCAAVTAETLFWLYTLNYVSRHANPRGDGTEWMAEVPLTIVFLGGVLPAVFLCIFGWWSPRATKIGTVFAATSGALDLVFWM